MLEGKSSKVIDDTNVNKEEKERNIRLEDQELDLHSRDAIRFSNPGGQLVM
jgi:hypothetical protein